MNASLGSPIYSRIGHREISIAFQNVLFIWDSDITCCCWKKYGVRFIVYVTTKYLHDQCEVNLGVLTRATLILRAGEQAVLIQYQNSSNNFKMAVIILCRHSDSRYSSDLCYLGLSGTASVMYRCGAYCHLKS